MGYMRRLLLLVVLALVVSACGDDTGSDTTTTVSETTTTTTAAITTTTEAAATTTSTTMVTTTTGAGGTTTTPPSRTPPDPFEESTDGAAGSGCAPGSSTLPDGYWFGFAHEVSETTVTFDLACFYFGDIAWEKAAEQGDEAPNDFWIGNENPNLRVVDVAPNTTVWRIPPDIEALQPLAYFTEWPLPEAEFSYTPCPGDFCTVWLETTDGVVTEIVEQYIP